MLWLSRPDQENADVAESAHSLLHKVTVLTLPCQKIIFVFCPTQVISSGEEQRYPSSHANTDALVASLAAARSSEKWEELVEVVAKAVSAAVLNGHARRKEVLDIVCVREEPSRDLRGQFDTS